MELQQRGDSREHSIELDGDTDSEGLNSPTRVGSFRPYVSIVPASFTSSPPSTPLITPKSPLSAESQFLVKRRKISAIPPWRSAIGRGFFALDDASGHDYNVLPSEEEIYLDLLVQAYRGFSDIAVGSDVPVEGPEEVGDWSVDVEPKRGVVEGDQEVLYNTSDLNDTSPHSISTPAKLNPSRV